MKSLKQPSDHPWSWPDPRTGSSTHGVSGNEVALPMISSSVRHSIVVLFASLTGSFSAMATAGTHDLLLGGTQWGAYSSYSYLGWLQPLPGARLGKGWYISGFVNYLRYRYNTGSPVQTVATQAPGGNVGFGYAGILGPIHWSASAAVGFANFDAQPSSVPGAARPTPQGAVWTFTPQIQWNYALSQDLALEGIDNYSFGQKSYWTDWRGKWQATAKFALGPEGIVQGGQNYQIQQVGLFADLSPFAGWQLGLAGGVSFQSGLKNSGYFGLSFSKSL